MRCVWAPALMVLFTSASALAASGQLVLACKSDASAGRTDGSPRDALLVIDFDRDLVFHDGAADGSPISAIKKFFITWRSEDGAREGHLNRLTLEVVVTRGAESARVRTTYACEVHAQLTFKPPRF